jgi:hypothetical protein
MQEATIVERLRGLGRTEDDQTLIVSTKGNHTSILSKIDHEAASLIERQQQVIDLLMKAVEPFAEQCDVVIERVCPEIILIIEVRVMDLRRAREAKVEAERILNSTPSTAL